MGMTTITRPIRFNMAPASELPPQVGEYKPPKSRDPHEIARRTTPGRPAGTLVLEQQTDGIGVIRRGFDHAADVHEFSEWIDATKFAAVGTALYLLADPSGQTAQRHTRLPALGAARPELRPDASALREKTIQTYDLSYMHSFNLLAAHVCGATPNQRKRAELATAKTLIHAAFLSECVEIADITANPDSGISNRDAQLWVRERCMGLVKETISLALEHGAVFTTAQFAPGNQYSPAAVAIHNTGTDFQAETLQQLQAA
jgi:hypothetical protein